MRAGYSLMAFLLAFLGLAAIAVAYVFLPASLDAILNGTATIARDGLLWGVALLGVLDALVCGFLAFGWFPTAKWQREYEDEWLLMQRVSAIAS